ncbi:Starch-binding associating with outer membrane [Pedobacter sp. ok626]|uniref:RagB/SusD family nutrient uptake outer membrane protein n=1 Tax=Pedobacter sp. ok626 TaxID=1761882 RepID=UPI00089052CE|nr:RagB/SusD family nutrient uptake outer membrane protein [Pedobacter sp. ok626]SDL66373.1 Starch-binding associating with outer membrane [Pedobacter sp. ok626]
MKKILILMLIVVTFSSCKKFLEEYSQNQVYASTAKDLDEVLIGECYMYNGNPTDVVSSPATFQLGSETSEPNYPFIHVMDDDSEEFVGGNIGPESNAPRNTLSGFHRWQPRPFINALNVSVQDNSWKRFYKSISRINAVIELADELRGKEDNAALDKIEGEARFLRAGYYYLLVNLYAVPFNKATAVSDEGVPMKLNSKVEDKFFTRESVQVIYDQIFKDLQRAKVCLQNVVIPNPLRPNLSAVNSFLSRLYLYTEQYELCIQAADAVLNQGGYSLLNLNGFTGASFTFRSSPETIFTQGGYSMNQIYVSDFTGRFFPGLVSAYKTSSDLISKYSAGDLRRTVFFKNSQIYGQPLCQKLATPANQTNSVSDNFLIRLPEVYLNKAEAQAVLGRSGEAQATVQVLRTARFAPANLTAVTATGADLVTFVRDERRRELCYEGQRWFDLRRYAVNSLFPFNVTILHNKYTYSQTTFNTYTEGSFELKSYAEDKAAYVLPIPDYAIEFNQGSLKNLTRPVRTIK